MRGHGAHAREIERKAHPVPGLPADRLRYDEPILLPSATMSRFSAVLLLSALIAGKAWSAEQQLNPDESGVSAPARPAYSLDANPHINRLDFDFRASESTAWLNADGDFYLQGWVKHRSLVCATYQMGVRFGIGSPGCLNVEWISDPVYVTSQFQCNGARAEHSGGDTLPDIGAQIARISCAERVIRCSGSCK
jgi:hypothetical protein